LSDFISPQVRSISARASSPSGPEELNQKVTCLCPPSLTMQVTGSSWRRLAPKAVAAAATFKLVVPQKLSIFMRGFQ
jgi:hypothetical protein